MFSAQAIAMLPASEAADDLGLRQWAPYSCSFESMSEASAEDCNLVSARPKHAGGPCLGVRNLILARGSYPKIACSKVHAAEPALH